VLLCTCFEDLRDCPTCGALEERHQPSETVTFFTSRT
jgi:hypothetical protein